MPAATLVRSTLTGVRPLGVRGEPLHAAHEQIRGVVRRRLGERHARLLAEPQPDDVGRRIDWYSEADGAVAPLSSLPTEARAAVLAEVESLARDIEGLGAQLAGTSSDDARLLGRALALAVRRPSDDYVFLVGDQPVVVCWGYEVESAGAIVSVPTPPAATPLATASTAMPTAVASAATMAPAVIRRGPIWPALLVGLLGILLLIGATYWLRQIIPVGPDVAVTQLPPPQAPPVPPPPPDPAIALNNDLGQAQQDGDRLKATLASLRESFTAKRAACKPPEPPKPPPTPPPPVVEKKPEPPKPPAKPPQVVEKKPAPPPPKPPDDGRLRLPKAPTTDLSFLKGCWRTDPFRHHSQQPSPGVSEYCFDANGRGSFVFRRAGLTCRTSAQGRYEGTVLRLRDADTTCSDGTTWY
ncbi:MAG: hypothetical protein AB7O88_09685 [Reyranellaceae bacterium]